MKTEKELQQLQQRFQQYQQQFQSLQQDFSELSDKELEMICGGSDFESFWEVIKKIGEKIVKTA